MKNLSWQITVICTRILAVYGVCFRFDKPKQKNLICDETTMPPFAELAKCALYGVVVMVLMLVILCVQQAFTESYFGIGFPAEDLRTKDPHTFALLARARQHALRSMPVPEALRKGGGLIVSVRRLLFAFRTDSRYQRLASALYEVGMRHETMTEDERKRLLNADDTAFLLGKPREAPKSNFILEMVQSVVAKVLYPRRPEVYPCREPATEAGRLALKEELDARIRFYVK